MIRRVDPGGLLTEDTPLRRITPAKAAEALERNRGLRTVGDLLEYLPRRYLNPAELTDLGAFVEGEEAFVVARIARASTRPMRARRGRILTAVITDGAHEVDVTFFKPYGHEQALAPGRIGSFSGTASTYRGRWQLTHPEYTLLDEEEIEGHVEAHGRHLIPVYAATGTLTSMRIRNLVDLVLGSLDQIREPVPEHVQRRRGLVSRAEAVAVLHRPLVGADLAAGLHRVRYDEAFVLQTILAQRRATARALVTTARTPRAGGLLEAFDARLPFALTDGQREVGEVLAAELARPTPMHRLLQGEVGSGKTVVAVRAMLAVVDSGGQAALLAPTEVLAAQHHRSIQLLLGPLAGAGMLPLGEDASDAPPPEHATQVALLTGSQSAPARRAALDDAATGRAGIVVGTHALIQEHVAFEDLGLVVVDEQHRFGVEQRDALRDKGTAPPHELVMTATPIPRTVAMTVFGDMETLALTELPAGRSPIETFVVDATRPRWVERTWERVAEEVAKGHQVYVVCPKIGDPEGGPSGGSDVGDTDPTDWEDAGGWQDTDGIPESDGPERELAGVYAVAAELRANAALDGMRVEVLHGRLDPAVKDATMASFGRGEIDVLVATTVIEVGVDVPNASTMVVMDADRFGLSQLHQLRGRVGRGSAAGLCLLMTGSDAALARERLAAVAGTTDGFELARLDLALRREGDVLGARQSGRYSAVRFLRMGDPEDEDLIAQAREDATALVEADPDLSGHPQLRDRVAARLDEAQAAYLGRG